MTNSAEPAAVELRPERYEIEVGYVVHVVGRWEGRDAPFTIGIEVPHTLASLEAPAQKLLEGGEFTMNLTSARDLRKALEHAMAAAMGLAADITKGEISLEELAEQAPLASIDGEPLDGEERL